jgi:hypothetical protein
VTITAVVVGALALSDRVADEAFERVPLPRNTSTPFATSTRTAAVTTPDRDATRVPDVLTSLMPHPGLQAASGIVLADGWILVVGGRVDTSYGDAALLSAWMRRFTKRLELHAPGCQ